MPNNEEKSPIPDPPKPSAAAPAFSRLSGETPRAFSAFLTWFQLGHNRSLQVVADTLDESISNLKKWSSRFYWNQRLHEFNAGLLQNHADQLAGAHRQSLAHWNERLDKFREQEWDAAQKLLSAGQCFLESFGEEDLGKMTLSQVSRALSIASRIGRAALAGAELPDSSEPVISPAQQQMLDAIKKIYSAAKATPEPASNPSVQAADFALPVSGIQHPGSGPDAVSTLNPRR